MSQLYFNEIQHQESGRKTQNEWRTIENKLSQPAIQSVQKKNTKEDAKTLLKAFTLDSHSQL